MPRGRAPVCNASLLSVTAALALYAAPVAAQVDAQALGDFVLANLTSVPEGNTLKGKQAEIPTAPCLAVSGARLVDAWLFTDPVSRVPTWLQVWNAFRIPFWYATKDYDSRAVLRPGAIVVGYELDASAPGAPDDHRRLPMAVDVCGLGATIVAAAPAQIIELGSNRKLAEVTEIDPSPGYYWWHLPRQTLRVRFVQRVPITYLVNGLMVPGHVVIAFSH